jgi:hypothetical protein
VYEINTPPFWPTNVPGQTNYVINALNTLVVTNTAADLDNPANPLTYALSVSPAVTNNVSISPNGVITWPPQGPGVYTLTTVVTDTNIYALTNRSLSATNAFTVTVTNLVSVTNPFSIFSIVYTNISGTNGFLLTWFAPSNDLFQVQWTPSLAPASWNTFTNPPAVGRNTNAPGIPPNAQFNFFDDGSQTGGFDPTRFYRLILLQGANTLTLPAQTNLIVSAAVFVTVTNTAVDSNPAAILTYNLVSPPDGAGISTNGVISWTNASPSGLAARFTTVVTDNGAPQAGATNTFTVFVMPSPSITNVTVTATNTMLSWLAPTNDQFQVQWTTNLA